VPGVPRPLPVLPSPVVRALQVAVDALAAARGSAGTGGQVLVDTRVVLAQAQRVQALGLALLAEVDRLGLHALEGAPSTARWVEAQGVGADRTQVAVARRLDAFALVADAVLAGRLTMAVAQRLQTALTRLRPHVDQPDGLVDGQPGEQAVRAVLVDGVTTLVAECRGGSDLAAATALARRLEAVADAGGGQLSRLEAAFLVLAQEVEPGQVPGCLALLVDALLPLQLQDRARRGEQQRALRLVRTPDGSGWHLEGRLDLECGERLHVLLRAELARDADTPLDTELAAELRAQGLDPYDPELAGTLTPRSRAERAHDALSNGLARYLAADLGGTHDKNPVQIVVTVGVDGLEAAPGALPARTASGARPASALLRRWACGSAFTRHVLGLAGLVLATSHTARTLTSHERRALHTQTHGHCQGAGCRRSTDDPGTVLHPHHGDPWARSGTTSLSDTVLLCTRCHRDVHDGRQALRLKDGRRLSPEGWSP